MKIVIRDTLCYIKMRFPNLR